MRKNRRNEKIGIPPGSLVYIGKEAVKSTITLFHYTTGNCIEKKIARIEESFPYLEKTGQTWIHINGFNEKVVEAIGKHLHWHLLAQEDILFTGQRPKLDDYKDFIYIAARMLTAYSKTKDALDEQVSLLFGKNYLVSFTESSSCFFEPLRRQINKEGSFLRQETTDYLAYAILDAIVDYYFVAIEQIDDQLAVLENKLTGASQPKVLHSIIREKREVINLRKHIWPMREVVRNFQRSESTLINPITRLYLSDVYDHSIQAAETIEGLRDVTDDMVEIYLASANQRLNQIMTLLTIIATIFVPLTFIASIYGMNFKHMPGLEWHYGYPLVLGVMLILALGMLYYFYRKKWL